MAQLKDEKIDVIISSPYIRTIETATPISKYLNLDIVLDSRIQERNHGRLTGQPVNDEAHEELRRALDDFDYQYGGGESVNQMMSR